MTSDDRERGLYDKYHVERLDDQAGKHDGCWYFVLDIRHDLHAREALAAYAESCNDEYPQLARDLITRLTGEPYEGPHRLPGWRDEVSWAEIKEVEHETLKRAENDPGDDGSTAIVRPQ